MTHHHFPLTTCPSPHPSRNLRKITVYNKPHNSKFIFVPLFILLLALWLLELFGLSYKDTLEICCIRRTIRGPNSGKSFILSDERFSKTGVAQWWEHSPPTNVARVRFPASASYVGWVSWFSSLLLEVFIRVLRFPLSTVKNQHLILVYFVSVCN